MGVVVRSPANRKIDRTDCKCFIFPQEKGEEPNYLCFREGVVGALTNKQETTLCTQRSFVPEKEGGTAKDSHSQEVQNILRTIDHFTEGVHRATKVYEDSGKRDIPFWRQVVREEVIKGQYTPKPPEKAPNTSSGTPKSGQNTQEKHTFKGKKTPPVSQSPEEKVKIEQEWIEGRSVKDTATINREIEQRKQALAGMSSAKMLKTEAQADIGSYRYGTMNEHLFDDFF